MKPLSAYYLAGHLIVATMFSVTASDWPGWRGPEGQGVSPDKNLPVKWSTNENVRWRVALPERGNSSPIVWSNRVFVTQALSSENRRTLICFDRANGLSCSGNRNSSWSSMLLAGGKIYVPNQSGDVFVLRASPKFEILGTNSVNEATNGSLAASNDEIFLRTDKSLWCFSNGK